MKMWSLKSDHLDSIFSFYLLIKKHVYYRLQVKVTAQIETYSKLLYAN